MFGCMYETFLTSDFDPISINSVLATLRLSLLANNHSQLTNVDSSGI